MSCGIYKIQNKINNKCYIGQSKNIEHRWICHKSSYSPGSHDSYLPIHQAMQKYGLENFDFTIVEECLKEELNEKEKYYIKFFNSKIPNGYNCTDGGIDNYYTGKPVEIYDLEGNYETTIKNGVEVAEYLNCALSMVYHVLEGKLKSVCKKQLKYKNDNKIITKYENHTRGKTIIQLKNDEIIAIYPSAKEAGKQNNIDTSSIIKVCRGKRHKAGGYIWKYAEDINK